MTIEKNNLVVGVKYTFHLANGGSISGRFHGRTVLGDGNLYFQLGDIIVRDQNLEKAEY